MTGPSLLIWREMAAAPYYDVSAEEKLAVMATLPIGRLMAESRPELNNTDLLKVGLASNLAGGDDYSETAAADFIGYGLGVRSARKGFELPEDSENEEFIYSDSFRFNEQEAFYLRSGGIQGARLRGNPQSFKQQMLEELAYSENQHKPVAYFLGQAINMRTVDFRQGVIV